MKQLIFYTSIDKDKVDDLLSLLKDNNVPVNSKIQKQMTQDGDLALDRKFYTKELCDKILKTGGEYCFFCGDIVVFEKTEVTESEYCVMDGFGTFGYPEPSDDFEYAKNTFDPQYYCKECGRDKVQIAPFRVKRRHKWTRKGAIKTLHWEHDFLFVEKEFYESFFKPLGIGCMPLLLKSGAVIKEAVQLVIPTIDESLDYGDRECQTCPACNKVKYRAADADFFPRYASMDGKPAMFFTKEYFGDGGEAFRKVIVKTEILNPIIEQKMVYWENQTPLIPLNKQSK